MDLQKALAEYLLSCSANGLSQATVKWYRTQIGLFLKQFAGRDLDSITTNEIRQYLVDMQNRDERYTNAPQKPAQAGGLSPASIKSHKTALHAFWSWCTNEYNLNNPMKNIKRGSYRATPKANDPHDFMRLLQATGDDNAGKRDRAILCFLADTGCRLGGLLSLELDRLFIERKRAIVHEKGNTSRMVAFMHFTGQLLATWLAARQSATDHVFVSMTSGEPLTVSGVHSILKRLKAKARVEGRVNPHSFRHGFARTYLTNGGDLATLAKLLGHTDINTTTSYYAIFSEDELVDLHHRFSPLRDFRGESRTKNS